MAVLNSLNLSPNALKVLEKRYLKKNEEGTIVDTPEEMFRRVAKAIASADANYGKTPEDLAEIENEFYSMMTSFAFLPNSPTLMNAGRPLGQLSACFVLPVEDSMESIFDAVKNAAIIHKCLTKDTLVFTNPAIKPITEIKVGNKVMTDFGKQEVTEIHQTGIKEAFRIETDHGYEITGSEDHLLREINTQGEYVWKRIGDLRMGDWLAIQLLDKESGNDSLPEFEFKPRVYNETSFKAKMHKLPKELTTDLSYFFGVFLGDGSFNKSDSGRIRLTIGKDKKELIKKINSIIKHNFDLSPQIKLQADRNVYDVCIQSVQIKEWLEFLGIRKNSARSILVPSFIMRASPDKIAAFVRGLFDTDGCINKKGYITLTSSSKDFIKDLQVLLLYFGIPTIKRELKNVRSWQITITTKEGTKRFAEKIGFAVKSKKTRLTKLNLDKMFNRKNYIPNQHKLLAKYLHGKLRRKYDRIIKGNRQLNVKQAEEILNHVEIPELRELLTRNQFYVKVSDVNSVGLQEMYDLTVPGVHSYIANGFISHNSGGGTGFSFSRLRPAGDVVGSTKGVSSGPISFMTVFDSATEAVKQGGTRRGANMGLLRVNHPNILDFITCKDENTKLNNFNISVGLTEEFMKALSEDREYELINPRTKQVAKKLRAREVFNLIVTHAWKNGEPGIVFLDRLNASNPTPQLGEIESTNPCGEQPLLPFESCNLGSINLAVMVKPSEKEIDWEKLKYITWKSVHFLDNVIEVNKYPIDKIDEMTKANRKIGLGVMGWADMLIHLGIPYNSSEAVHLSEKVMGFIQAEGRKASMALARERGVFPNYKDSIYDGKIPLRNATITTIAPTGTLSIIAGCSSGVEPLFAVSFVRTVLEGTKLIEVNPYFEKIAKERGFWSRELMERIADKGGIHDFNEIPSDVKAVFVTAHDITPMEHIEMQAAFQKYVDNAVSKTVNFPHNATPKDVEDVYLLAYKLGCKGVTVYRDGSREQQVLSTGKTAADNKTQHKEHNEKIIPKKRPEVIRGVTRFMKTGCGNIYVTINEDDNGHMFELFTSMGKAGGCAASQAEAIGRLVSLAFRSNIDPHEVVNQLKGISCHQPAWCNGGKILSCSDAIAKAVEKYNIKHEKGNGNGHKDNSEIMLIGACPECGGAVEHESGCAVCHNCGFTKCS